MKPLPAWAARYCSACVPIFVVCACILATGIPAPAQSSALTLPRNLAQLVDESQTVVQGWVTDVALQPSPQLRNLMTVVVTLRVEDSLKGDSVKSFTFSQAVIDRRDLRQRMGYRIGQHLLLILISPSAYGLTSPAGLEQGRFRIAAAADGKLLAANGLANSGLFRALDSQLKTRGLRVTPDLQSMIAKPGSGPVSLDQLKTLIRTIAAPTPQP